MMASPHIMRRITLTSKMFRYDLVVYMSNIYMYNFISKHGKCEQGIVHCSQDIQCYHAATWVPELRKENLERSAPGRV